MKSAVIPINQVSTGTVLIPDGGFDCMLEGCPIKVFDVGNSLAVPCNEGTHFLDGQIDGENLIGFYLAVQETEERLSLD